MWLGILLYWSVFLLSFPFQVIGSIGSFFPFLYRLCGLTKDYCVSSLWVSSTPDTPATPLLRLPLLSEPGGRRDVQELWRLAPDWGLWTCPCKGPFTDRPGCHCLSSSILKPPSVLLCSVLPGACICLHSLSTHPICARDSCHPRPPRWSFWGGLCRVWSQEATMPRRERSAQGSACHKVQSC